MCFDAKTSLTAFVSGMLTSACVVVIALQKNQTSLAILAGGWSWVIFMQWWEYKIWEQEDVSFASKMAYMFNVMQVPLLYLLFIVQSKVSLLNKIMATFILFLYLCTMLYPNVDTMVRTTTKSHHLTYPWWSNTWRCCIYFIALASIFLLLIRPFTWSVACVLTLFLLLLYSRIFYYTHTPSLWCFFAVFFPVLACLLLVFVPN